MVNLLKVGVVFMKKSIRLLLSFLSFSLLYFSCSNNLESNSLVISFNLQNQNVQRTVENQENLNVTVTLYDVLTTDFKIIETQTVPIVNNKALVQIDNVQIGTNALITAQITQNNQTLYEGKSEIFTVSEGKNQVKIQLKKVSSSELPDPEDTPGEQENTSSVTVQLPNDVSFDISVSKVEASINIQIENLPEGYEIKEVLVDGNPLENPLTNGPYSYSDFDTADILFITVVIKDEQGNFYSKEIQYSVEDITIVGE